MHSAESKLQITPETKVGELLESYPELEELLISLAPPFKNLKNPLLKKTVARVTSLKQASAVGNIPLAQMMNELRKAAGLEQVSCHDGSCSGDKFTVSDSQVKRVYDAREDLKNGAVPAIKVMNDLKEMTAGEVYKLITPFLPAPLIDKAREKGFAADCKQMSDEYFETYFLNQLK